MSQHNDHETIIHVLPSEIFAIIFDYLLLDEDLESTNPKSALLFKQVNNLSLISHELNELMEDYFNKIWIRVFDQLVIRTINIGTLAKYSKLKCTNLCQTLLDRKQLKSSICKLLSWKQQMKSELLQTNCNQFSLILLSDHLGERSEFHKQFDPYDSFKAVPESVYTGKYNHIGEKGLFFDFMECNTKLISITAQAHEKEDRYHCVHYRTGNAFIILMNSIPLKKDYQKLSSYIETIQFIKDSSDFPLIIFIYFANINEMYRDLARETVKIAKETIWKIVQSFKLTNCEIIAQLDQELPVGKQKLEFLTTQTCFNRFIQGPTSNFELLQNFILDLP